MSSLVEMVPKETRQRTTAEWRRVNRLNLNRARGAKPEPAVWDSADCAAVLREANKIRAPGRSRVMGIGRR